MKLITGMVVALLSTSRLAEGSYQVYDLGSPGLNCSSYATSINSNGKIGGHTQDGLRFTWSNENGLIFHPPKPSRWTGLTSGPRAPFIDERGNLWDYPVNEAGQSVFVGDKGRLYLRSNGSVTLIDNESEWFDQGGYIARINNVSEIVGQIKRQGGSDTVKYVNVQTGEKYILPIKARATVTDINDEGQIVGWYTVASGINGFLWTPRKKPGDSWQSFPNFMPTSINDTGVITGIKDGPVGAGKAVIWENGLFKELDVLTDLFTDRSTTIESIETISDINNDNDMVGWGQIGNKSVALLIKHRK